MSFGDERADGRRERLAVARCPVCDGSGEGHGGETCAACRGHGELLGYFDDDDEQGDEF